jgi:hypothetical protein
MGDERVVKPWPVAYAGREIETDCGRNKVKTVAP